MIIAFVGLKGGAGKSTAAIGVAAELVSRGARVLLVDGDPQGTARTWADVAAESGHPAPTTVAMGATMHRPGQLDVLVSDYDHAVIDLPPRLGDVQRAALMVADLAVVPSGPSPADAWAAGATIELVQEAQGLRPELAAVVLITRQQPRTVLGRGLRGVLSEGGLPVLRAALCNRVAYQEAVGAGLGVGAYAPRDPAAKEMAALVTELLEMSKRWRKRSRR